MSNSFLIAYASRHGSTAEVAQAIGNTLAGEGHAVDVQPMSEVAGLEGYDAVVVGSPLYSAHWLPEVTEFVKAHRAAWGTLPTACFVLAIRLRDDREDLRDAVYRAISTERAYLQPQSVGMFAGAIDYDKLSPITRLQAETKRLPEGDFRDWDAVKAWASTLPELLAE